MVGFHEADLTAAVLSSLVVDVAIDAVVAATVVSAESLLLEQADRSKSAGAVKYKRADIAFGDFIKSLSFG